MLKNIDIFFHLWICICLTVSSWLYPGCVYEICALSVSYQQAYDSYSIIHIKMHKTYKCGLINNITQMTTWLLFRLRMLCAFMPILVQATEISGLVLCYVLGVPHWPSFHNTSFHRAQSWLGLLKHDTWCLNPFTLECLGEPKILELLTQMAQGNGLPNGACFQGLYESVL